MRTYAHHVLAEGTVRVTCDGAGVRVEADGGPDERVVIEITNGQVVVGGREQRAATEPGS